MAKDKMLVTSFSSFPTMFSNGLFSSLLKVRIITGKGLSQVDSRHSPKLPPPPFFFSPKGNNSINLIEIIKFLWLKGRQPLLTVLIIGMKSIIYFAEEHIISDISQIMQFPILYHLFFLRSFVKMYITEISSEKSLPACPLSPV